MSGETIGVLRPTTTDLGHGDTATTYPDPSAPTHTISGVAVEPRPSSENHDGRSAVIVGLTLYLPTGADVRPDDHLVVRGVVYEAEGEMGDWRNPFVDHGGIVQAVKRVRG